MTVLDTFGRAIEGFSAEHPIVAMGIVVTALYVTKAPIGSLLDNTKQVVTGVTDPSKTTLKRWRDGWSSSASADERVIKEQHGQGVLTGALSSGVFLAFLMVLVILNFGLILRPLRDILTTGEFFGFPISLVGAIAIAVAEFIVGAVLLNAIGKSHLIQLRKRGEVHNWLITGFALAFMLVLSGVEAGLAVYRDYLRELEAGSRIAAIAIPAASATPVVDIDTPVEAITSANTTLGSMPAWVQAALGVLLPWIIAIAVMPVEMLLRIAPVLIRRIGGILVWVPEAICVVASVIVTNGFGMLKAVIEIASTPADVIYRGVRPILQAVIPQLFEPSARSR